MSVCVSFNMSTCLAVVVSVFICVGTCLAALLMNLPSCLNVCYVPVSCLFVSVCLSVCRCVRLDTHTVWLSSAFLPVCLSACLHVSAPLCVCLCFSHKEEHLQWI